MYPRALVVAVSLAFAILLSGAALAQTPATALTGLVSSVENGAMEGVLVSASQMGSPITVTVVTGKDGRFTFPASKLAPGFDPNRTSATHRQPWHGNPGLQ